MLRKKVLITPIALWRLESFFKALAHLLKSGLPLLTSLELLQTSRDVLSRTLSQQLQNKLKQGLSLSIAWQQLTQEELSTTLLHAAEQSGTLNEILSQLAQCAQQQRQMRHFIWQALRYPLFLLLLTLGLLIAMCQFIIPSFAELYANFNVKLPWFTLQLIAMSNLLFNHTQLLGILTLGIFLFSLLIKRRYPQRIQAIACALIPFKKRWHSWQFWHTMTTLLNQGIPFLSAGKICCKLLPTLAQQNLFIYVLQQLQHGQSFSAIIERTPLFQPELLQLFILGESSGQLSSLLQNYIEQEYQALNESLAQFKTWLEPAVMCTIGILLGTILLALYLPMIQLGRYV